MKKKLLVVSGVIALIALVVVLFLALMNVVAGKVEDISGVDLPEKVRLTGYRFGIYNGQTEVTASMRVGEQDRLALGQRLTEAGYVYEASKEVFTLRDGEEWAYIAFHCPQEMPDLIQFFAAK